MKWLTDNKTSLENIQNAAKLPALKQLLLECNIGSEKDSSDILVQLLFIIIFEMIPIKNIQCFRRLREDLHN